MKMGIMDMFNGLMGGGQPAQPTPPATQPTPPGNINQGDATGGQPQGTAPNGVIPPGTDTGGGENKTPLDDFADLWKNEPPKDGAPPKDPNAPIFANVDPKKFMEAAGRIDFAKTVTPDQLKAIANGGEESIKAFITAMNTVAQTVYAQSSFATTKIVDAALSKARQGMMAELPTHIKKAQVSDNLRNDNPIYSNPAVQPIIGALEAQLTVKYPNASATEITNMAKTYVEALGTSFSPKKQEETGGKNKQQEADWSTFLS
jgi:hypothetical protein